MAENGIVATKVFFVWLKDVLLLAEVKLKNTACHRLPYVMMHDFEIPNIPPPPPELVLQRERLKRWRLKKAEMERETFKQKSQLPTVIPKIPPHPPKIPQPAKRIIPETESSNMEKMENRIIMLTGNSPLHPTALDGYPHRSSYDNIHHEKQTGDNAQLCSSSKYDHYGKMNITSDDTKTYESILPETQARGSINSKCVVQKENRISQVTGRPDLKNLIPPKFYSGSSPNYTTINDSNNTSFTGLTGGPLDKTYTAIPTKSSDEFESGNDSEVEQAADSVYSNPGITHAKHALPIATKILNLGYGTKSGGNPVNGKSSVNIESNHHRLTDGRDKLAKEEKNTLSTGKGKTLKTTQPWDQELRRTVQVSQQKVDIKNGIDTTLKQDVNGNGIGKGRIQELKLNGQQNEDDDETEVCVEESRHSEHVTNKEEETPVSRKTKDKNRIEENK